MTQSQRLGLLIFAVAFLFYVILRVG